MNSSRRQVLATAGTALTALPLAAAAGDSPARLTSGLVDCQSRLFFPEVLDLMRRRKPSEHLRSIYMDFVSPLPEAMRFALDFGGAHRLLFSSDHPWVQPKEIPDPFRSLGLSAKHANLILRDNARQWFHL